jgi:hypothetical protein
MSHRIVARAIGLALAFAPLACAFQTAEPEDRSAVEPTASEEQPFVAGFASVKDLANKNDWAGGVAIDPYGTSAVGTLFTAADKPTYWIARYSPAGALQWSKTGSGYGDAMVGSSAGRTYAGIEYTLSPLIAQNKLAVLAYQKSGLDMWSAGVLTTPLAVVPRMVDLALGPSSSVVWVGTQQAEITYVGKLDSGGAALWSKSFAGRPTAVALDAAGKVCVVGSKGASAWLWRMSADGVVEVDLAVPGPAQLTDVAVRPDGKLVATGKIMTPAMIYYGWLGILSADGVVEKGVTTDADTLRGVALDSVGRVFVTGSFYSPVTSRDVVVRRYSADLVQLDQWTKSGTPSGRDEGIRISALANSTSVAIVGNLQNAATAQDVLVQVLTP